MSRLEIEIDAKKSKAEEAIEGVSKRLEGLQQRYNAAQAEIKKYSADSLRLEGALKNLDQQYKQGAITQSHYDSMTNSLNLVIAQSRQEVEKYTNQLRDVRATMKQVAKGADNVGKSFQSGHRDFSKGIDTASVSLTRQVFAQRAALSSANNLTKAITALSVQGSAAASSFGVFGRQLALLATSAGTSGVTLRSLLATFSGPAGLTIAVSVAVTAITGFIASMSRAKQEAKEAKNELEQYRQELSKFVSTQDLFIQATYRGNAASAQEISTLRALRATIEDESQSRNDRVKAINEIRRLYPSYFKNLSNEKILAGEVSSQYNKLTQNILAAGKARGAMELQVEEFKTLAGIEARREARTENISKLSDKILKSTQELQKSLRGTNIDASVAVSTPEGISNLQRTLRTLNAQDYPENKRLLESIISSQKVLNGLTEERRKDFENEIKATQAVEKLQQIVNNSIKAGGDIIKERTSKTNDNVKALVDYASKLDSIFTKAEDSASISGLEGLDATIEKTRQKYVSLMEQINKVEQQITNDKKISEAVRTSLLEEAAQRRIDIINAEGEEQTRNIVAYERETQDAIDKILADANISRVRSREQELSISKKKYDELERQHRDNAKVLEAIDEARGAAQLAINSKYDELEFQAMANFMARANRNRERALIEQLENEARIKISKAKDDEEALMRIYEEFARKRRDIQIEQAKIDIIVNNDGSVLYKELAQANLELKMLKENFEQGLISEETFNADRERLQDIIDNLDLAKFALEGISDFAGNAFASILFDGQNTTKNLARAFKSLASSVISDFARMAAAKAIANIFSGGAVGFLGRLIGFSGGGYTGDGGKNSVAGLVHKGEFVFDADTTKKYRALFESIHSGKSIPPSASSVPQISTSPRTEFFIAENRIEGSTIVTSYKRAIREQERYVG